jgi:hypothetical protein
LIMSSGYPGNRKPQQYQPQAVPVVPVIPGQQYQPQAVPVVPVIPGQPQQSQGIPVVPGRPVQSAFDLKAEQAIPATVYMISGCHDSQTSADVSNLNSQFSLPNPQGKAGGACTAALLSTLYEAKRNGTAGTLSWVGLLRSMRSNLLNKGFDQIPQLTSSRMIDVNQPFQLVNNVTAYGTKRAVLIGINYVGQTGELSGCHNDVKNMREYLEKAEGFESRNITILMDDGRHQDPTRNNIMNAYRQIVRSSQPGDTVFCHYSGHGGRVRDVSGDEDDGFDETLIPVDFQRSGQIIDDDLYKEFVQGFTKGVLATCLMDCCHSGTVLDLPYRFTADGDVMTQVNGFDFDNLLSTGLAICCIFQLLECVFSLLD